MHVFGPFTDVLVCREKCMSAFSAFVLTTGSILFRYVLNGNYLLSSVSSFVQHLALKSVYEKSQYIMGDKSFSSRTVFKLAHAGSSSYTKQVT